MEAAALIGLDLAADLSADDVTLVHDQVGDAYGAHTEAATEAIELLARTEAVVVDPVYSAKGLAGLIALVRSGDLGDSGSRGPIVFWHTGGYRPFRPAPRLSTGSPPTLRHGLRVPGAPERTIAQTRAEAGRPDSGRP